MPQYGEIYLNKTIIFLNMSEFTIIDRSLNTPHTKHGAGLLYKSMSTYLEMGIIENLVKDLR